MYEVNAVIKALFSKFSLGALHPIYTCDGAVLHSLLSVNHCQIQLQSLPVSERPTMLSGYDSYDSSIPAADANIEMWLTEHEL